MLQAASLMSQMASLVAYNGTICNFVFWIICCKVIKYDDDNDSDFVSHHLVPHVAVLKSDFSFLGPEFSISIQSFT